MSEEQVFCERQLGEKSCRQCLTFEKKEEKEEKEGKEEEEEEEDEEEEDNDEDDNENDDTDDKDDSKMLEAICIQGPSIGGEG